MQPTLFAVVRELFEASNALYSFKESFMAAFKMKNIFIITSIVVLTQSVFGGAWVQKKGGHFFKLSIHFMNTNYEFDHEGNRLKILKERLIFDDVYFRDVSFSIYSEYGLSDIVTLVGYLPFKSYTSKRTINTIYQTTDEQITTSGFGDLLLSGRLAIFQKSFALSFQSGIKIPMGYSDQPDNDGPRLGTGDIDFEGQILMGVSLYPLPVYITGGFGYRHRLGELHDELLSHVELGFATGRFLFKTYVEWIKNTNQPPDIYGQPVVTPLPGGGGVLPETIVGDQDILKLSPSIIYYFNQNMGVQLEISAILAGKNTVSGTTFSLALILTYL